jgi:hypothetical protein
MSNYTITVTVDYEKAPKSDFDAIFEQMEKAKKVADANLNFLDTATMEVGRAKYEIMIEQIQELIALCRRYIEIAERNDVTLYDYFCSPVYSRSMSEIKLSVYKDGTYKCYAGGEDVFKWDRNHKYFMGERGILTYWGTTAYRGITPYEMLRNQLLEKINEYMNGKKHAVEYKQKILNTMLGEENK